MVPYSDAWKRKGEGVHEYLRVNKIHVSTETTKRDDGIPVRISE
jgi:hypothetical protein